MMSKVQEVEVVVAHSERVTMRVGDVFLKIDADQRRTDVEVEAMAPIPTPEILSHLLRECEWLVANDVLPTDVVTRNRRIAESARYVVPLVGPTPAGLRSPGTKGPQLLLAGGDSGPPETLGDVGRRVEVRCLLQERQVDPRSCLSEVGYWVRIGTRFASHMADVPMPGATQPSDAGRAEKFRSVSPSGGRAL